VHCKTHLSMLRAGIASGRSRVAVTMLIFALLAFTTIRTSPLTLPAGDVKIGPKDYNFSGDRDRMPKASPPRTDDFPCNDSGNDSDGSRFGSRK